LNNQQLNNTCNQCGKKLDPTEYSKNTKFCKTCAYERVKGRGLKRYYKNKGTCRVSVTISIQHKNFIEKEFIDLRSFLRTKLDEEINKRTTKNNSI